MKLLKILPFASILPALMLSACGGNDSSTGAEAEADEVFTVKTATVEQRDVDDIVTLTASVEADKINNISSNSPNRIKQILVDEGMNVSKGQRLVVLDDVNTTSYQLQVDNAKAALRTVEADYNRAVELLHIGGGTRQQVDQMERQVVNARNTLASAERALRNVQENTVLTAPVSGVVTARNYDPGDMTASLPILTIGTVNPVKVVVNVNESDFAKVHTGMPATLSLQSYPDEEFTGKVTLVAPTVDAASRTFGVEITVPNPSARILPGMFGRIQLNLGTAPSAVVADKAVEKQRGSGNYFVYVVEDGKIRYSQVQLGRRLGDTYQILSGVEPGQQVVISQKSKLTDGAKVKVVK
ncbi:MAG: efflux RND transporter periplasmic adaptor subunit [Muribaculaceae bacterium]|nr:efflux RND transporter periplasmic adaptor subunit [Muribaculaceae bacterium]